MSYVHLGGAVKRNPIRHTGHFSIPFFSVFERSDSVFDRCCDTDHPHHSAVKGGRDAINEKIVIVDMGTDRK